jgi:hypothetical protein
MNARIAQTRIRTTRMIDLHFVMRIRHNGLPVATVQFGGLIQRSSCVIKVRTGSVPKELRVFKFQNLCAILITVD